MPHTKPRLSNIEGSVYGERVYGHSIYGADNPNEEVMREAWPLDVVPPSPNKDLRTLLHVLALTAYDIDQRTDVLYQQRFVGWATGEELNNLGRAVDVHRRDGETDQHYRTRIRMGFARSTANTNYEDFARICLNVLQADQSEVSLDTENSEQGEVIVRTFVQTIEDTAASQSEMKDYLGDAVPAGHRVQIEAEGSFGFAGNSDNKGFNDGTWTGRI